MSVQQYGAIIGLSVCFSCFKTSLSTMFRRMLQRCFALRFQKYFGTTKLLIAATLLESKAYSGVPTVAVWISVPGGTKVQLFALGQLPQAKSWHDKCLAVPWNIPLHCTASFSNDICVSTVGLCEKRSLID